MTNDNLAITLKALADPTRLKIFEMLLDKELCVCEIVERLKVSQPLASHHLRELKIAGLALDRREGNWVHYRLNAELINELEGALGDLFSRVTGDPAKSGYPCADIKPKAADAG